MTPTVKDAYAALEARKEAAGLAKVNETDIAWAATLSGTDLDRHQVETFGTNYGTARAAYLPVIGPMKLTGSAFVDGLVTGLELARLRRKEERIDERARE